MALAGGWFVLTILPPVTALSTDYITSAPRLLYIPAVGVSLLWAWVLVALGHRWSRGRGRIALYLALLGLVLAPAAIFVRQRVTLYRLAARPMVVRFGPPVRSLPPADLCPLLPHWTRQTIYC